MIWIWFVIEDASECECRINNFCKLTRVTRKLWAGHVALLVLRILLPGHGGAKVKDRAVRTHGTPPAGTEHMHQVLRSSLGWSVRHISRNILLRFQSMWGKWKYTGTVLLSSILYRYRAVIMKSPIASLMDVYNCTCIQHFGNILVVDKRDTLNEKRLLVMKRVHQQ